MPGSGRDSTLMYFWDIYKNELTYYDVLEAKWETIRKSLWQMFSRIRASLHFLSLICQFVTACSFLNAPSSNTSLSLLFCC